MGEQTSGEGLRPGMIIGGKFALISQIGEGGAGVVFEAEDTWIGRRVALKVLHPRMAADREALRLLRREARAAARIHHPNIVAVYEVGQQQDGAFYIVQELLHGASLRQRLDARRRLTPAETLEIVVPIMGALVAAHEVHIVHRDVKPDNILLARGSPGEVVPKLIDFGIAKVLRKPGDATRLDTITPLPSDDGAGTPWYMSPEQARGDVVDAKTDVWAMGTTMFEMLAGDRPFDAPSAMAVMAKLLTAHVPRLEQVAPHVPADLADVVQRALVREIEGRYPSMRAFLDAVLALAERNDPTIRDRHARSLPPAEEPDGVEVVFAEDGEPDPERASLPDEAPRPEMEWEPRRTTSPVSRLERCIAAAEHALRVNALGEAVAEAERAVTSLGASGEDLGRMRLVQAIAHRWLGSTAESERCAMEAMEHLSRGSTGWYAALGHLAMAYGYQGKNDLLIALAEEMSALQGEERSPAYVVSLCRFVVMLVRAGAIGLSVRLLGEAKAVVSGKPDLEPVVQAWLDFAAANLMLIVHDDLVESLRGLQSAATNFVEAGDVRNACLQRVNVGSAYMQLGAYAQAAQILRDNLPVMGSMKLALVVAATHANLGLALARLGHLDEALAAETTAIEECVRQGHVRFEGLARAYLAEILRLRGDRANAEAELRRALALVEHAPPDRALVQAGLADLLLEDKRTDEAFRLAHAAIDTLEELDGVEEGEALIRLVFVLALHAKGRPRSANVCLAGARYRLLDRARRITDHDLRKSFLEAIPENARTLELAHALDEASR